MDNFTLRWFGSFWRGLVLVLSSPFRSPVCALSWWIGGLGVFSLFMEAGLNPQSRSAAFMKWSERLGPLMLLVYATLGLGLIGGPWALLDHFLVGKPSGAVNAKRNASNQ